MASHDLITRGSMAQPSLDSSFHDTLNDQSLTRLEFSSNGFPFVRVRPSVKYTCISVIQHEHTPDILLVSTDNPRSFVGVKHPQNTTITEVPMGAEFPETNVDVAVPFSKMIGTVAQGSLSKCKLCSLGVNHGYNDDILEDSHKSKGFPVYCRPEKTAILAESKDSIWTCPSGHYRRAPPNLAIKGAGIGDFSFEKILSGASMHCTDCDSQVPMTLVTDRRFPYEYIEKLAREMASRQSPDAAPGSSYSPGLKQIEGPSDSDGDAPI
ncbi:uncharacterized protein I303_101918 [Kwoniella dejecticola CBS 10117]|uniref:Uncharacterized protein n=1 Tax=Kwoniella dejecticola CBS 10117 TaxID=1296121 RepID=A0A1A6ACF1_9TREE|nr:uncharacterized protein I303_01946 [Kwoniella dejecticola CBS 10117]OBR87734.1 hypothetical protein I303_01946 [Kwoniella dejecticola CBS 10117]